MANKRIGVTGITSFKSNCTRVKSAIKSDMMDVVVKRSKKMEQELDSAMTGEGRHTRRNIASTTSNPGSGIDVPGTSLEAGMIGEVTGRMRGSLQTSVKMTKYGPKAEVGFGKQFRSMGGAANNAIKWPTEASPIINVVRSPEIDSSETHMDSGESPEQYVPEVLLGTQSHVGRNILRLALYEDIKKETTLKDIERSLKNRITDL